MTLTTALKLHLRVLEIHRRVLRVVTLRPQTATRFSTNYFHDTWHILGGTDGAALLGRLLWGLAFQRQPGTLVLIDDRHLVPTPFEADPADPILLIPDGLTRVVDDDLRALRLRLRRAPGAPTTIRWHTFGMPAALAVDTPWQRCDPLRALRTRERMARRAGYLCYTAPPAILRDHGLGIYRMHACSQRWGSYFPLAERAGKRWHYDGEFQQLPGLAWDISAARVARREVGIGERGLVTDDRERQRIYDRKELAAARLRAARRGER
jgi:hypothetical protein